jgi:hypothetical protein
MSNGERILYFWLGFLATAIGFLIYSGLSHEHWPEWLKTETVSVVVTTIATIVIAIFTVRLSDSTERLWDEAKATSAASAKSSEVAKEAVDVSKKSLEIAQRAFVFCKHIQPNIHTTGHIPNLRVREYLFVGHIENSGTTPATDVRSRIDWARSAPGVVPAFNLGTQGAAAIMGPTTTSQSSFAVVPLADLRDAFNRVCDIHVRLLIEYRDIFNPEVLHYHEICAQVLLVHDPIDIPPPGHPAYAQLMINGPQNSAS